MSLNESIYDQDMAAGKGITLAGRYSEWEYYNSDHAFLAGKQAVESLQMFRDAAFARA